MIILRVPRRLLALAGILLLLLLSASVVRADTNADVVRGLIVGDVYVTPVHLTIGHVRAGDKKRLQRQVDAANIAGVREKIAIVSHFPSNFHSANAAAQGLLNYLELAGTLIVVGPKGVGVASDSLNSDEERQIQLAARPICLRTGFAACAIFAAKRAASQVRTDKNTSFHDAAVFWVVVSIAIGILLVIVALVLLARRRQRASHSVELRQAANNTLGLADEAIQEIEASTRKLSTKVRGRYDQALGLRERARNEIDRAASDAMLTQGNQDAAQAVLALQGVTKDLGIKTALNNPLDLPTLRCFYCGREDRPPYTTKVIDDARGNTMDVSICAVDAAKLAQRRTPQIATTPYQGGMLPWWAVPNSPWYYSYGGPTWQYWLPFTIGLDVGSWYGGGWEGGYGYGDFDGGSGGDPGLAGVGSQQNVDTSGDFGGASDSSGGWGGTDPSGGGDSGGWGGGDSGGGDFGGGGDSGGGGGDSGGW